MLEHNVEDLGEDTMNTREVNTEKAQVKTKVGTERRSGQAKDKRQNLALFFTN